MRDHTRLTVWKKSFELVLRLEAAMRTRIPGGIPGLRAQTLRAAASISANICEGCGKNSDIALASYMESAIASARELDNHMRMCAAVGLLSAGDYRGIEDLRVEVLKMAYGFRRSLLKRR